MPLYQSLLVSASDRRFIAEHGYLNSEMLDDFRMTLLI